MQVEQSILYMIQRRQLKWYGHLFRKEDSRWPKKIYHPEGGEIEDHNNDERAK